MKNFMFDVRIFPDSFVFGISLQFTQYPYEPDNRWINFYIGFLCWEIAVNIRVK